VSVARLFLMPNHLRSARTMGCADANEGDRQRRGEMSLIAKADVSDVEAFKSQSPYSRGDVFTVRESGTNRLPPMP
jgi:hypothetical protein